MTRILEQCNGTIKDGLCMKCFNRAATSSSICTQMYEVEDKKAPVLEELPEPIGNFIFANANGKMMPDGAYYHYSDVCNLLMRYASQERTKAIHECIDELKKFTYPDADDFRASSDSILEELEKLKK